VAGGDDTARLRRQDYIGISVVILVKTFPGVDVMITIFCDFWQFSAKKIGVFLKNQCYDQNFG
jgi:hypothetical protein